VELRVGPEQVLRLAVSAGTAVFPDDGVTYDALLATADRRMYRDKTRRASASGERPVAAPYAPNRPKAAETVAKETVN
jgi:GGDEF domain-containing protein